MNNSIIVIFNDEIHNKSTDIEIPINITAHELVIGLNQAFSLGIDITDFKKCFLKSEKPIALLRGNKTLSEYGLRNGSIVYYTK